RALKVAMLLVSLFLLAQWTTSSLDDLGTRHSPLTQITPANVGALQPGWTFQSGAPGKWEATPLVIDGTSYTSGQDNRAWAIDARTGREIWRYQRPLPAGIRPCCGRVNRGLA